MDRLRTPIGSSFRSRADRQRYWLTLSLFILLGLLAAYGLLVYKNPVPVTSPSFIPVVKRRMNAIIAMFIAASSQSLATVAFQSITNNRVITPPLLVFEALYSAIQTGTLFFFGVGALISFTGAKAFGFQVVAMVVLSLLLYGWLLGGKYGDMQLMLLVGIIMGTGLRSISSFMRRMLAPSEFDILQARLFGSVNNAKAEDFPLALTLVLIAGVLLYMNASRLNVVSLGEDVAVNLGVRYRRNVIYTLVLVSVLMSVSTALIGPLSFFGFLVATLTYQITPTYNHRYLFLMAFTLGFLVLAGSYFLMYHVFNAQGVVSIIIELCGGLIFLFMIFRKGEL